jgi:hypothetical protein
MVDRGAGCMGKPLVRFCEGQEFNCDMVKILWHRRESRRKQRKQTLAYRHGSLLSTRNPLDPRILFSLCMDVEPNISA